MRTTTVILLLETAGRRECGCTERMFKPVVDFDRKESDILFDNSLVTIYFYEVRN